MKERDIWNIIWDCFTEGNNEMGVGIRGCEEGGINMFEISKRVNINYNETLNLLNRLRERNLIEYMVSPDPVFIKAGIDKSDF